MRFITLSILSMLLVPSLIFAQDFDKLNVAVLDLELHGLSETYRRPLSDRLREELFNTGRFKVIERNNMESILGEQGFQLADCTSDECAVMIGRLLGVNAMIAGSIALIGTTHTINVRVIDVETGEITLQRSTDCRCPIDEVLTTSIRGVASLLAGTEAAPQVTTRFEPPKPVEPGTRSKGGVLMRSMILPGWGQFYSRRTLAGTFYSVGEIGSVAFLFIAVSGHNGKVSDYDEAKAAYDAAIGSAIAEEAYETMQDAYDQVGSAETTMYVAAGAAGGIYLINIIDAIIFGPRGGSQSADSGAGNRPRFALGTIPDSGGYPVVGLSFQIDLPGKGRAGRISR